MQPAPPDTDNLACAVCGGKTRKILMYPKYMGAGTQYHPHPSTGLWCLSCGYATCPHRLFTPTRPNDGRKILNTRLHLQMHTTKEMRPFVEWFPRNRHPQPWKSGYHQPWWPEGGTVTGPEGSVTVIPVVVNGSLKWRRCDSTLTTETAPTGHHDTPDRFLQLIEVDYNTIREALRVSRGAHYAISIVHASRPEFTLLTPHDQ